MTEGTTPAGVRPGDEAAAARWVREMFGRVAPRYDLLNHLLSFQVDRYWRRWTVRKIRRRLGRDGVRVLDLCCGTGDLLASLYRAHGCAVYGADFCYPMLEAARAKLGRAALLMEADALAVPVRDGAFDVVTVAFGLRNLANYRRGLAEMHRILRPGGLLAILEFSWPRGRVFGSVYEFYFRRIVPGLGGIISGTGHAYRYLQQSVEKFLPPEELAGRLRETGFRDVRYWRLTGGIAVLHVAEK